MKTSTDNHERIHGTAKVKLMKNEIPYFFREDLICSISVPFHFSTSSYKMKHAVTSIQKLQKLCSCIGLDNVNEVVYIWFSDDAVSEVVQTKNYIALLSNINEGRNMIYVSMAMEKQI